MTQIPSNKLSDSSIVINSNDNLVDSNSSLSTQNNQKSSWWQKKVVRPWNNLPLKTKITTLLVLGAAIPVVFVTQGIVTLARNNAIENLQEVLKLDLAILEEEITLKKERLVSNANAIAVATESANIIPREVSNSNSPEYQKLQSIIQSIKEEQPEASFYIITDNEGKTVAQSIQIVGDSNLGFPKLPTDSNLDQNYQPVTVDTGIPLSNLSIVRDTLEYDRGFSGYELVSSDILEKLGLLEQANIGLREQNTEGLSEEQKPYSDDTFYIEDGKLGIVMMATQPVNIGGEKVGTALVGTLFNRNYQIVDRLKNVTGVPTATIFAKDWRVSTNVLYTDNETRAIGTRVSKEVADTVLNEEQSYFGEANIIGIKYLTGYSPIYDHRQELEAENAKPIGIAYVGIPETRIFDQLRGITLIGYSIGGGIILICGLFFYYGPSDAGISRQLKNLSQFAGKVASSESGVRLPEDNRQDEIGLLTRNLNEMAQNVDANIETRQQEAERQKEEKEQLELAIYQLLEEIQDAADGDLTVRASLDSMEMSTVADLFNAVIDSLQDIAIQVKDSSKQVTTSLNENELSIQMLANQAIEEAEQTRNTLGQVEKMSSSIEQVAENANEAATLANSAYQETQEGTSAMDETANSIQELRTTVGETAKKMKRLGESSQKISQVVSLIEEIALKTNLLAINASVEASRAGEQGQGFTVVAEQVGALASQSANATKEITKIVAAIQAETKEVSQAMELGTTQVVDSTRLVESTKDRLGQVLERSRRINELMQQISQSTVSQTDTSQLVTNLMQLMAQKSEQRLQDSVAISESIQSTAQVAQKLEEAVEQFEVEKTANN